MTTVKYTLDPDKPPKTSKKDLERFDAIKDADIDYSDMPELDDDFWANAEIMPPRQKSVVTMRMDQDTIDFFKGTDPKGFTSRMVAVLQAYARAQQAK